MTPLPAILDAVCERFVVTPDEVRNCKRESRFTLPRHVFCYLATRQDYTLKKVGRYLDRDHATVIYGRDRVQADIELYPHIARAVADVLDKLDRAE